MPDLSRYARSRAHQERAHALIPGGAHTYAKGDDQMPEHMPVVIARGEGCRVWDLDGNDYIEYGMGLRAVTLGHAEPRVTAAASRAMEAGLNFTRPAAIELEAAETLAALIPSAERVKFCKDGSSATTAAVKLARAATGRDLVAVCSDHPFLSQDDWFIGTTEMNAGIPQPIRELTVGFPYGDPEALRALFASRPGEIACVILEAVRGPEDPTDYLREVQAICAAHGAVFVLDEMITGFRWDARGAQGLYGITPDLSTFGKALANGFACSALVGRARDHRTDHIGRRQVDLAGDISADEGGDRHQQGIQHSDRVHRVRRARPARAADLHAASDCPSTGQRPNPQGLFNSRAQNARRSSTNGDGHRRAGA